MSQKFCTLLNSIQEHHTNTGKWPTVLDLVESFDCTAETAIRALKRAKWQVLEVGYVREFHHT